MQYEKICEYVNLHNTSRPFGAVFLLKIIIPVQEYQDSFCYAAQHGSICREEA